MTDLEGNFDVIIFGTGLVESIAAAALSKAGVKVAHLDHNPYYGGDEASLTLDELARWADDRSESSENSGKSSSYLYRPTSQIHIHLAVWIGSLLSSLIASGVSRYGGYRLLERVGIYSSSSGLQNVPGSKEDVFKSSLSLIEKRRLMRFLVFASGDFEGSKELQGHEQTAFPDFLTSQFSLTQEMVDAIAYALAFCSSTTDATFPAMTRLRSYLPVFRAGFCRVSAVNGGVYILDKKVEKITAPSPGGKFVVELDDFPEPLTADVLIAAHDQLPTELHPPAQGVSLSVFARCTVVVDKPIPFPPLLSSGEGPNEDEAESAPATAESDDTGGPTSKFTTQSETSVEAPPIDTSLKPLPLARAPYLRLKANGNVVYLSLPVADGGDPEQLLKPYLDTIFSLTDVSESLFKVVYMQHASPSSARIPTLTQSSVLVSPALPPHLTEQSDSASSIAERLFFSVVDTLKAKNPEVWTTETSDGESISGDRFVELKVPMWPPLEGPGEEEE
ncbi:FAD/NAD-P-binding domain-containing protein [Lactarius psammicola]|nr:FAD/NAD-P-binding domain-containing protein [Lactarius psammicola]